MTDEFPTRAHVVDMQHHIRSEFGDIDNPYNYRLKNQLYLGLHFPEFIPNVVVPQDEVFLQLESDHGFPVQAIKGQNWLQLINARESSLEEHLFIVTQTLTQLQQLWDVTGILLADRNPTNIILSHDGRVYQVDFELLTDVFADNCWSGINDELPPRERQRLLTEQRQHIEDRYKRRLVNVLTDLVNYLETVILQKIHGQPLKASRLMAKINRLAKRLDNTRFTTQASFADLFKLCLALLKV